MKLAEAATGFKLLTCATPGLYSVRLQACQDSLCVRRCNKLVVGVAGSKLLE